MINQLVLTSDKKQESRKEKTTAVKPIIPTEENAKVNSNKKQ